MGDSGDEIGTNHGDGGACPGGSGCSDEAEREKSDARADDHEAPAGAASGQHERRISGGTGRHRP